MVDEGLGMVVRAFASKKFAEEYASAHPGMVLCEVGLDEAKDPTEEFGPPHTVHMVVQAEFTYSVHDVEFSSALTLNGFPGMVDVRQLVRDKLVDVFSPHVSEPSVASFVVLDEAGNQLVKEDE